VDDFAAGSGGFQDQNPDFVPHVFREREKVSMAGFRVRLPQAFGHYSVDERCEGDVQEIGSTRGLFVEIFVDTDRFSVVCVESRSSHGNLQNKEVPRGINGVKNFIFVQF
jgi:hypothetical protein